MSQNLNNSGLGTLSSGGGNSFTTKEVNLSKPIKEEAKPQNDSFNFNFKAKEDNFNFKPKEE